MKGIKPLIFCFLVFSATVFEGCNSYQKTLRSTDLNLKYQKAEEYFNKGDYQKALPLLENIMPSYLGTARAENISYYMAYSYYKTGQYELASYQFKNFADSYPLSPHKEEAYYLYAYTLYIESPQRDLDQDATRSALSAFQLYLNMYPDNTRVDQVNQYIDNLKAKLEQKDIDNALLYYKIEDYKAAVWAIRNVVAEYPTTKEREKLEFLVLKSAYLLAENSVPQKKLERYRSAYQYYGDFKEKYPKSKYKSEADKIGRDSESNISKLKINQL
jgi:outer membrane protein assembly factor BamD